MCRSAENHGLFSVYDAYVPKNYLGCLTLLSGLYLRTKLYGRLVRFSGLYSYKKIGLPFLDKPIIGIFIPENLLVVYYGLDVAISVKLSPQFGGSVHG